ncbi:MAG: phosphatase PAP2 family protein [Candidatus Moranbacteria bacterium]|nr:phosphatase PAP2 family protein [Candidatus Moranbacteria bacterium]
MELKIVKFFNKLGLGVLDKAAYFVSRIKYLVIFWTILALGFLFLDKQFGQKIFLGIIIASAFHFLISEGLIKHTLTKIWGKRTRPYILHREIIPIGRKFTDSSFPSSHMSSTLAILTVVVFFYPIFWVMAPAFLLALFMAYARMHQGMHYLSDVIAGAVLGIIYGLAGIFITNNFL